MPGDALAPTVSRPPNLQVAVFSTKFSHWLVLTANLFTRKITSANPQISQILMNHRKKRPPIEIS